MIAQRSAISARHLVAFDCTKRRKRLCLAAVGIDLGTCNSAIAVLDGQEPRPIRLTKDSYTIPSEVLCTANGLVTTTEAGIFDEDLMTVIRDVKRILGRDYHSVQKEAERLSYTVKEGQNASVLITCSPEMRDIVPEEVSSTVLGFLVRSAERNVQESVDCAVISIPSNFSPGQKAATLEAARIAGIERTALLQEPIAAALAYGFGRSEEQDLILVIDVGGGTFDVSIISSFEGIMEIIAYAGDPHLGGRDFDHAITDWIIAQMPTNELSAKTRRQVNSLAEMVKIEVVSNGSASFSFNGEQFTLDLAKFDEISRHLIDKLLVPIFEAGKEAKIDWIDTLPSDMNVVVGDDPYRPPPKRITQVILAGGSSTLPALQSHLKRLTGLQEIKSDIDSKLCVALGATVFAGMLEGAIGSVEIMDGAYVEEMHARSSGFPIM